MLSPQLPPTVTGRHRNGDSDRPLRDSRACAGLRTGSILAMQKAVICVRSPALPTGFSDAPNWRQALQRSDTESGHSL
jgi:hypothetical protein